MARNKLAIKQNSITPSSLQDNDHRLRSGNLANKVNMLVDEYFEKVLKRKIKVVMDDVLPEYDDFYHDSSILLEWYKSISNIELKYKAIEAGLTTEAVQNRQLIDNETFIHNAVKIFKVLYAARKIDVTKDEYDNLVVTLSDTGEEII